MEQQLPQQGRIAAVNGMEMYYEVYGQRDARRLPLVLLHGFNTSSQVWAEFVPALARQYQLIIPDLRGHGRSTNPSGRFTHRQSALDVFALLDRLGVDRCMAMGISTGGMTLTHMATSQPERLEAMVLIGSTSYFPEQARAIMARTTPDAMSPEDWEWARRMHPRGDEQIRALVGQFHAFKDSYDDMNFTPPLLSTIRARTLVVHGDRDEFFPVSIPVQAYQSIPHAYLWIVPNGGHVPIVAHPEVFTATVLEFLRGDWERQDRG